jgi:hypothetical protein
MASNDLSRVRPLRWLAAATVVAATLGLSACVVAPVGYQGEVIGVAPPPPQAEVYGPPPVVGQIWIGGYWNWVGGRHVWAPGYWSAPRPGHYWVPHRWAPVPGGWRHEPGHWERR